MTPLRALIVATLSTALLVTACSLFKPSVKQDEIDCGNELLKTATKELLPSVIAILTGGQPNWQQALDDVEHSAGDAAICAVIAAVNDLESQATDAGPAPTHEAIGGSSGPSPATKGRQWLSTDARVAKVSAVTGIKKL